MKAVVLKQAHELEVRDVPEPEMAPDQIKVKIAYAGLCGSDIEILEGRFVPPDWTGTEGHVMGHEASGTITAIGKAVRGHFRVGERVAMNFRSSCGACYYCSNGMEHFCEQLRMNSAAMAETAVYYENCVFPLPDEVPMDVGAFLEPVSVAVHAIDKANIRAGSSVMITGAGPIGLLIMQLALRAGAAKLLVSEPLADKRKLAKELGADVVVDPLHEDLAAAVKKLTGGRGFDTVMEASGKVAVCKQVIPFAHACGTIVWCGVYPATSEVAVPPYYMYDQELTVRSIRISPYTFPRALALLSKLTLKPLLTAYLMKDALQAFADHMAGKGVKMMIQP